MVEAANPKLGPMEAKALDRALLKHRCDRGMDDTFTRALAPIFLVFASRLLAMRYLSCRSQMSPPKKQFHTWHMKSHLSPFPGCSSTASSYDSRYKRLTCSRVRVLAILQSSSSTLYYLNIMVQPSLNPEFFFPSLGQNKRLPQWWCIETFACSVGTRLVEKVYPNVVS